MKVVELREKNKDELLTIVDELKAKIQKESMEVAMNTKQDHRDIRNAKKDLARVMTVINEKECE